MKGSALLLAVGALAVCAAVAEQGVVEFHRAGGFLGVQERMVVFEDGSVRLERSSGLGARELFCGRLASGRLEGLWRTLEDADFSGLEPEYLPKRPVYDGYTYGITYRGHTVRTQEPVEEAAPENLHRVLRLLQEVLLDVLGQNQPCPSAGQGGR